MRWHATEAISKFDLLLGGVITQQHTPLLILLLSQAMGYYFLNKPLCVGATTAQLATCAVRLHSDKQLWTQLRKGALHFSREVQSGDLWTRQLSQAVRTGLAR